MVPFGGYPNAFSNHKSTRVVYEYTSTLIPRVVYRSLPRFSHLARSRSRSSRRHETRFPGWAPSPNSQFSGSGTSTSTGKWYYHTALPSREKEKEKEKANRTNRNQTKPPGQEEWEVKEHFMFYRTRPHKYSYLYLTPPSNTTFHSPNLHGKVMDRAGK